MLDPRKVRGLLKTIRDFADFDEVEVSDGETTVKAKRGAGQAQVQEQARPRARKEQPRRSAISSLGELPPVGVYPEGV